jgi:DNA repair ATPase RecN
MSSPYEELIAALQNLKEKLRGPHEMMKLATEAEELQEAMEAKAALNEVIGNIPLPGDHPDFAALTGAIGEAVGKVDNVNQAYQQVRDEARAAAESIVNASYVVDSVVMGFQQGMG